MPGDLNLKKSWHPALAKNRLKVKAAEDAELKDRRDARERQAEIAKVRELEELKALQSGIPSKVSWMYDKGDEQAQNVVLPGKFKKRSLNKRPPRPKTAPTSDAKKRDDPMARVKKR